MSDMQTFPETVDEFMEHYKIIDTEQIYTNGVELVPIFRMKQWFEHLERKKGKWIDGRCDQCGGDAPFWSLASTYYRSRFCQHCGARMEECDETD